MVSEKKIEWENNGTHNTLKVRNVGGLNKDAQIQMTFDRWDLRTERSKPLVCIDIPSNKVKEFMEGLINNTH